jgi:hypothetical protein
MPYPARPKRPVLLPRLQEACQSSTEQAQVQESIAMINEEVDAIQQYQQSLSVFEAAEFGQSKPASSPGRPEAFRQQHARPAASSPSVADRRSSMDARSRPNYVRPQARPAQQKRPPPSRDWNSHQAASPAPRGKGAAAKVDSRRPKPAENPAPIDKQPWDSWTGQDKELAVNLADDIMEASPGITWNDIAGLADAKRILQVTPNHS